MYPHLSRPNGFPCLLATNSPPNTLYKLLSEDIDALSFPSVEFVAESLTVKQKKKPTVKTIMALIYLQI